MLQADPEHEHRTWTLAILARIIARSILRECAADEGPCDVRARRWSRQTKDRAKPDTSGRIGGSDRENLP